MKMSFIFSVLFCVSCYYYGSNFPLHISLFGFVLIGFLPNFIIRIFDIVNVIIHEVGHGVVSRISKGFWIDYKIDGNGNGVCHSSGGNNFFISLSGYLGSVFCGCIFISLSLHWVLSIIFITIFGSFLFVISIFKAADLITKLFTMLSGLFLIFGAYIGKDFPIILVVLSVIFGDFLIYISINSLFYLRKSMKVNISGSSDAHHLAGSLKCHPIISVDIMIGLSVIMYISTIVLLINICNVYSI